MFRGILRIFGLFGRKGKDVCLVDLRKAEKNKDHRSVAVPTLLGNTSYFSYIGVSELFVVSTFKARHAWEKHIG